MFTVETRPGRLYRRYPHHSILFNKEEKRRHWEHRDIPAEQAVMIRKEGSQTCCLATGAEKGSYLLSSHVDSPCLPQGLEFLFLLEDTKSA